MTRPSKRRWCGGVLVPLLILGGLAALEGEAAASVVRDGDAFSIDVRAPNACVLNPSQARVEADCVGIPPASAADEESIKAVEQGQPGLHHVALVAARDASQEKLLAVVQITRVDRPAGSPDQAEAERTATNIVAGVQREAPPGASVKAHDTRIETVGGNRVVRTIVDIEGTGATDLEAAMGHQEYAVIATGSAIYTVAFMGKRSEAAAMTSLANDSVATITFPTVRVALEKDTKEVSHRVERLLIGGAVAIAILAFFLLHRRAKAKAIAEAAAKAKAASAGRPTIKKRDRSRKSKNSR